jgi:hypothetical protein
VSADADHVAAFRFLGYEGRRRHLIRHGVRLDKIGPLTGDQAVTLHAVLHAPPAEGCADLNVSELPGRDHPC